MAKTRANKATRQALAQIDASALRKHVRRSVIPIADAWADEVVGVLDDTAASVGHAIVARPEVYGFKSLKCSGESCRVSRNDLLALVRHAVQAGFGVAMRMHRGDLAATADAAVIVGGQRRGGQQGHESQSKAKERRAEEIRKTWDRMQDEGQRCTYDTVAAVHKCSRSTVDRAVNNRVVKPKKR
jgi:hypothetical protein